MSIGTPHHRLNQATVPKLKALIATPSFQRMWARPFKVDVTHEVPDTSGFNVLGTVYYLDKDFYAAVMSGQTQVPGMTAETIIQAALRRRSQAGRGRRARPGRVARIHCDAPGQ
jgi:DNA/RNA endonuclease G (NUC1)